MTKEIEARLKISAVDKTGRTFKNVSEKMAEVNRRAGEYNRRQADVARTQQRISLMGRAGVAGIVGAYAAKEALVDFAAVERQMTRIGITANATASETRAVFTVLQDETKKLAMPVQEGISALDTMVASGMSLKEAMAFLPSVLATAQASGASTEDIANTGLKAASALKIEAGELQHAFDIMVTGGKAGQFELKDMAQYIPNLANSFATLGYSGEEGLKKLVAILQTIREDTGDASSAATYAQNIFGKMYSADTATKFKKFGIDLRKEMDSARKSGEDAVAAFTRISKEAIKGDLSKLPLLFTDEQFRLGMQSLITSPDSLKRFIDTMNSAEVDGTVWRDVNRVLSDTQSNIDKMSSSFDKLKNSFGETIAGPASVVMEKISKGLDFDQAAQEGMKQRGWGTARRALGITFGNDKQQLAYEGGYRDEEFLKNYWVGRYGGNIAEVPKTSSGRQNMPIVQEEFPGGDRKLKAKDLPQAAVPLPSSRPVDLGRSYSDTQRQYLQYGKGRQAAQTLQAPATNMNVFSAYESRLANAGIGVPTEDTGAYARATRVPSADEFRDALKISATGISQSGEEAGQKVADGGREAGDAIKEGAALVKVAGVDVGAALTSGAQAMIDAARQIAASLSGVRVASAASGVRPVNADTGRTMPPSTGTPAGSGPQ